jgi:hypothetical protein
MVGFAGGAGIYAVALSQALLIDFAYVVTLLLGLELQSRFPSRYLIHILREHCPRFGRQRHTPTLDASAHKVAIPIYLGYGCFAVHLQIGVLLF